MKRIPASAATRERLERLFSACLSGCLPIRWVYGEHSFYQMTAFNSALGLTAHASAPAYETLYSGEWIHPAA